MITAQVRAWLIDAYMQNPEAIIMLATDAIYSTAPLILPLGAGLGEWEEIERDDIFIVQPGIYWSSNTADKPKTRGIPRSLIIERRDQFEAAWRAWIAGDGGDEAPAVMVPIQIFAGHRYAINRGNVDLAGRWLTVPKAIEFEWRHKRQPAARSLAGTLYTRPYAGHAELQSESYDPDELTDILAQSLEMEAAPDYEPWGNSGE